MDSKSVEYPVERWTHNKLNYIAESGCWVARVPMGLMWCSNFK